MPAEIPEEGRAPRPLSKKENLPMSPRTASLQAIAPKRLLIIIAGMAIAGALTPALPEIARAAEAPCSRQDHAALRGLPL